MKEAYNEFIKEYGSRYEWDNEGNPEFAPEWEEWDDLFCTVQSKPIGRQRRSSIGEEERLIDHSFKKRRKKFIF
jgi:hypothetical protein